VSFEEHRQKAVGLLKTSFPDTFDNAAFDNLDSVAIRFNHEIPLENDELLTMRSAVLIINHHLYLVKNEIEPLKYNCENAERKFHEFVHPLTHYLKSPLTAILGYASILNEELQSTAEPDTSHFIRRIVENSRILEKMLDELLYISRLKRENEILLRVKDIIDEAIAPFTSLILEKGITVKVGDDMGQLKMKRDHLLNIFTQLIDNALRHSAREKCIAVGCNEGEFCVQDEGSGIRRENLAKVFHIFFTTCDKDSNHTGSGLYIIKKILELYDGSVRIDSLYGKGTKVFFKTHSTV
jgi:signal transduction histidine kinase